MVTSITGAWNFDKYPIYPFKVSQCDLDGSELARLLDPLERGLRDVAICSATTAFYKLGESGARQTFGDIPFALISPFLALRVTEQATNRLHDIRKKEDERLIKTIADDCYAALRRIAPGEVKVECEPPTLRDIDSNYLNGIKTKPQELGANGGVPMAVFHRLHAAGLVRINSNGLVEAI